MPYTADGSGQSAPTLESEPVRSWLTSFFRRRIDNRSEVEDLVQDVFVRIAARDSTTPIEHLGGYVLKTALSVAADRVRQRRSRHTDMHVPFDPEINASEEIDPERVLSGKEDLRAATTALLSLPERTRTVFILRRMEGYRHRDIAAHLGISVSAVEKHMVKAIHHLSTALEAHLDP